MTKESPLPIVSLFGKLPEDRLLPFVVGPHLQVLVTCK